MGDAPFRKEVPPDEVDGAYYSDHDLRDMYARENTERRRAGGHTLRRYLTAAQDKKLTAQFVKLREQYDVACNDDVVIVFAQQSLAEGKGEDLEPKLVRIAQSTTIPERTAPVEPQAATA